MTIRIFPFGLLVVLCFLLLVGLIPAQQQKIRQTDPADIVTRDKIDRNLHAAINRLSRQIQADTSLLVAGTDSLIVYLPKKYEDTDYQIFLTSRTMRTAGAIGGRPLTDSSFVINKASANASTIQWMTIHK